MDHDYKNKLLKNFSQQDVIDFVDAADITDSKKQNWNQVLGQLSADGRFLERLFEKMPQHQVRKELQKQGLDGAAQFVDLISAFRAAQAVAEEEEDGKHLDDVEHEGKDDMPQRRTHEVLVKVEDVSRSKTYTYNMQSTDTVQHVKTKVRDSKQVEADFDLYIDGNPANDTDTLAEIAFPSRSGGMDVAMFSLAVRAYGGES